MFLIAPQGDVLRAELVDRQTAALAWLADQSQEKR